MNVTTTMAALNLIGAISRKLSPAKRTGWWISSDRVPCDPEGERQTGSDVLVKSAAQPVQQRTQGDLATL